MSLIEVKNLRKYYPVQGGVFGRTIGYIKAVDGVSFSVKKGKTLGLVGESGCGKTTVGRTILKLTEPTGGKIFYRERDITSLSKKQFNPLRRKLQVIFQDPYSSLNPRMTILDLVSEGMMEYGLATKRTKEEKTAALLKRVGLSPDYLYRYPHEFSGGQRQRIGIARALALEPSFIICDEPVSALDVSVQAQVINLLIELQKDLGHSYLFIAHDLGVVKHVSDRIAVMYLGHIMEYCPTEELFNNPCHPYTRALISAIPLPDPDLRKQREVLTGDLPSPYNPPGGCPFHTRCRHVRSECQEVAPQLKDIGGGHMVSCYN